MIKTMKNILTIVILCIAFNARCIDRSPIFAFYDFNKTFYNPAYAGADKKISLTMMGNSWYYQSKYSWYPYGYNPVKVSNSTDYNYIANLDASIFSKGRHNIGAGVLFYHQVPSNNRIDYEEHNEARLNISYGYQLKHGSIRAGISLEQMQDKVNFNISPPLGPFAATGYSRNIGAGVMYSHAKHGTYIGISSNYLISHRLAQGYEVYESYRPNFCILAGTDIQLSKSWVGQPSLIIPVYGAQINFCAIYKKKLTIGTGYSIGYDSWPIILGYNIGRFSVRYSNTTYIHILPNVFMTTNQHTIGFKYTVPEKSRDTNFRHLLP